MIKHIIILYLVYIPISDNCTSPKKEWDGSMTANLLVSVFLIMRVSPCSRYLIIIVATNTIQVVFYKKEHLP